MPKKSILIVDDDRMYLKLLSTKLLECGFEIQEVLNARESLQQMETMPFDLVITDVSLPDISGISLSTLVQKKGSKEIPFIFISAYPIHEMVAEEAHLIKD